MARTTTRRLRELWLDIHKWIGLLLAILIIPISITGAVLVWHDELDAAFHPQRSAVSRASPALSLSAYANAVREGAVGGERVSMLRYPTAENKAVVVTSSLPAAASGRPVRNTTWLDPGSARILDKASSSSGLLMVLHRLHGSLMVPDWGRPAVGWVGAFMFVSCLTGIWLWWPMTGSIRRGLRWRRRNTTSANLHHQLGFWVLLPLAMLSFTGVWISFPSAFGRFEAKPATKGGDSDRQRAFRAQPLASPRLTPEAAIAASSRFATGPIVSITWPTDQGKWKIGYERAGGIAEVSIDDKSGEATPPRPQAPETNARLMRRLHDGTDMGMIWRVVITLGGLIPAALAVTGIIMWLRNRGWRARLAQKRAADRLSLQAAE